MVKLLKPFHVIVGGMCRYCNKSRPFESIYCDAGAPPAQRDNECEHDHTDLGCVHSDGETRQVLEQMAREVIEDARKSWRTGLSSSDNIDFWNGYDAAIRRLDSEMRNWRIRNAPRQVNVVSSPLEP